MWETVSRACVAVRAEVRGQGGSWALLGPEQGRWEEVGERREGERGQRGRGRREDEGGEENRNYLAFNSSWRSDSQGHPSPGQQRC